MRSAIPRAAVPHALVEGFSRHRPMVVERQAVRVRDGVAASIADPVAAETPVVLVYNDVSQAVMMATPADLEDFATGFSLTEGIVGRAGEITEMACEDVALGLEIRMTIPKDRAGRLRQRQRSVEGRTGCGLCGIMSLEQALRPLPVLQAAASVEAEAITDALATLPALQLANQASGAAHAAAFATTDGRIRLVREDVGRHNAFDKLIGGMAREKIDPAVGLRRADQPLQRRAGAEGGDRRHRHRGGGLGPDHAGDRAGASSGPDPDRLRPWPRLFHLYPSPAHPRDRLNHAPLVRMANQIARAFAAQSPEAAVASTATHIRLFWDPRMRKGLREILAAGGEGLDPQALAAAERLAQEAPAG